MWNQINAPEVDSITFNIFTFLEKTSLNNGDVWLTNLKLLLLSHVQLFAPHQASLSFTIFQSLLKLMPIEFMRPSNHLILCHPLLLLPLVFPRIRIFSSESDLHIRWPKYWSFNFSISPSSECSGFVSFRIDWFDPAVQRTLKSLFQHHSSKPSIFCAQPSLQSNCHIHTWQWENHSFDDIDLCPQSDASAFYYVV